MLVDGTGANHLAFVYDEASEADSVDGQVMRSWPLGAHTLGREVWRETLRIALRAHGTAPWTAKQAKEHTDELLGLLHKRGTKVAVVMQSPPTPGVRQVHSAWNILGASGNPATWAGTALRRHGIFVCPMLHPASYEYVYVYLLRRWLLQAFELAQGKLAPLAWPKPMILPYHDMLLALRRMAKAKAPVAVDIETNMAGTVITAIGVSDGTDTISTPWHGYVIANGDGARERGINTYVHGRIIAKELPALLSNADVAKILHNGAFDVLQLAKHGIELANFKFDTLLMHRVAYPQFRRGLQQACATEFCVEPWKSEFKPPKVSNDKDAWLGDPQALRTYNTRDTFATWHLAQSLAKKIGISLDA